MSIETVRMSSKGQIVIPQGIRDQINAGEGTIFGVIRNNDTLVLKKIDTPSKEEIMKEINKMAEKSRKALEAKGLTEKDVIDIALRARHKK